MQPTIAHLAVGRLGPEHLNLGHLALGHLPRGHLTRGHLALGHLTAVRPGTALAVFAVVFVAELPDKSLFASLVLGARYRARWVWLGVSLAFVVHVVLAVAAGGVLRLLPDRLVEAVVAALFLLGAVLLLRPAGDGAAAADEPRFRDRPSVLRTVATSFGVVFVGEWGDITQVATANLAASYDDPLSVGLGAALGLVSVAGLAVLLGNRLLGHIPLGAVRRVGGVLLLAFGVVAVVRAVS